MSVREDIYNYEEKVSNLKKEINELSILYLNDPKSNSKLLSSKISSMKNELKTIEFQLDLFKISLAETLEAENIVEPIQNIEEDFVNSDTELTEDIHQEENFVDSNSKLAEDINKNEKSNLNDSIHKEPKNSRKDFENTIGKSFMGVLASILIFISFIMFAMLVYQKITDGVKIFAMYGISTLFVLFGLIKLKKYPKNKLYLSIAGCGIGALYISLILSNIYFKIMSDIVMYLLILCWAVFTAYLSRLRSNIFSIIGQTGILIAIVFGTSVCVDANDINKFFTLNIFFVVSAFLFNKSRIYSKNLASNIFNLVNLFFMIQAYYCFLDDFKNEFLLNLVSFILMAFIIYKFFMAYAYSKLSDENVDFAIINIIYLAMLLALIDSVISSVIIYKVILGIILIVMLALNEIKFKNFSSSLGRIVYQGLLILELTLWCFENDFISNTLGIGILAIAFILYGFYKNDKLFKYAGMLELLCFIFGNTCGTLHFVVGLAIFAILSYFIFTAKEQYSVRIKNITYILFLIFGLNYIGNCIETEKIMIVVSFIFCATMNLLASKSSFKTNFATGEEEETTLIITGVINVCLMIFALHMIKSIKQYIEIIQAIIIFVSLALFISNTTNLLKRYDGLFPGIYIGIKFTLLLLTILNAWSATNFVVSIVCILFAIFMITLGFRFKQKSFRIYGLVLVMICTFKLIMIDITYDNSIGQVMSFFVSGLLCLGINAMYNILDKKFLQDDSDGVDE